MLSQQDRSSNNTTTAGAESSVAAAAGATTTAASSSSPRQRQDHAHQPRSDDKQSRRKPADASVTAVSSSIPSSSKSSDPRTKATMPQYTSRDVGDPSQIKKNKQSMADLKLRRLTELNNRLREDLERERIPVSNASKSIIAYCNSTRDYMVPSVWGAVPRGEDPYAPQQSGGCCVVM
ncbi:guanine nucleotide-binding protein subunit gamma [Colletotrichum graminicola]|nr:guanine nucleotide-binding protein subunit gamma [Colletotrichum graminicola]